MNYVDKKMLELIEILKARGDIRFDVEFCRAVNLKKQNLINIKNEMNHFTPEHIRLAVKEYKIDANWIFGVSWKPFRSRIDIRIEKDKKNYKTKQ